MSSWPRVTLGDIFEIARGGSPRPIDRYFTDDPDGVNWVLIGDAPAGSKYIDSTKKRIRKDGVCRSRVVKPGDLLLSNSMSFGRPYIMRTSGCIHDGWLVLAQRNGEVDLDFFFHLLGSPHVYAEFARRAAGATVKNLNIELVRGVEVCLPPLPEQHRIAAILDHADALREKRRATFTQIDSLIRSIFLELFGDPATNPKGWPTKSFGDVCDTRLGKMLDQKKQTGDNRRPYLRNANVQWFRFDLSDLLEMDFDEREREILALRSGDLLICEGGEPGRAAVWDGQLKECFFQKALHRARPDQRWATPEYLSWLLWFLAHRSVLSGVTSATIAHLTGEKLRVMETMLPPTSLQLKFTRSLAVVDRVRRAAESAQYQLDCAFSALQDRAFRGTL